MALRIRVPLLGPAAAGDLFFRPSATDSAGGWLTALGSATLHPAIDETAYDDADYIRSSNNPSLDICKIAMTASGTPDEAFPIIVRYRYRKHGAATIDLRVRLLEGTTEITSWTHSGITTSYVTAEQTMSAPEVASVGNWANLFLEFRADSGGTPAWLPDGAVVYVNEIDEHYYVSGAEATRADVIEYHAGWGSEVFTTAAAAAALATGATFVVEIEITEAEVNQSYEIEYGDSDDFIDQIEAQFADGLQRLRTAFDGTVAQIVGALSLGIHRMAFTITPTALSMSVDESAVETGEQNDTWANLNLIALQPGGATLRSITVYPPVADAALPALSALP